MKKKGHYCCTKTNEGLKTKLFVLLQLILMRSVKLGTDVTIPKFQVI